MLQSPFWQFNNDIPHTLSDGKNRLSKKTPPVSAGGV